MDTSLSLNDNKKYLKYKSVVKKWEKTFVKENGRVPSKHDIREATHDVRYAYKFYFNMKSQVLESSLLDISLDMDDGIMFSNEFDEPNTIEMNSDILNIDNDDDVFHPIPTVDQIGKLMSTQKDCQPTDVKPSTVWGNHLNNKKPKPQRSGTVHKLEKKCVSTKLFESCTFNKRNPRKSLSFSKLKRDDSVKIVPEEPSVNSLIEDISPLELSRHIDITKVSSGNIMSINTVQAVMMKSSSSVRNINPGWLERCTDAHLSNDNLNFTEHENSESSQKTLLPESYGLKNLAVCPIIPTVADSCLSDFVENSESETELSFNKSNTFRKIRPVVKRRKIEKEVSPSKEGESSVSNALDNIQEESINDTSNLNLEVQELPQGSKVTSKQAENKKKVLNKGKRIPKKQTEAKEPTERRRTSRLKKPARTQRLTSDSECEESINKNVRKTRSKKNKNIGSNSKSKIIEDTNVIHSEIENYCIGDEEISFPRFPIRSSILKEHNLVDGLAAALEIPKGTQQERDKPKSKHLSEEEKMQKKIDDGKLNENFVRINLEKKVYVRGKKTMNFSKYKKQQWKNKKKMLHNTPEFPEGGVLKCFKCGQPGHMSRFCKAGKGTNLLALDEIDDEEKSPYLSLNDAESIKNKTYTSAVSENIIYECIDEDNEDNQTNLIKTGDDPNNISIKGIYQVPETFIKLLAATSSTNVVKPTIRPLYELSNGSLLKSPEEVKQALKLFGHEDFRIGQELAIMRILSGLSTLVTLSTGSGKSLCYQLPAYLYAQHNKCITLVISPLVSLMEDQVTSMPDFVHAACLHTNQSPTQREKIIELIKDGNVHILLISPEAIVAGEKSTGFGAILRQLPPIAFACIDEVHCVSQWSHNFRPSYLMICRVLREKLGVKCVLGLTATATKPTIEEIVQHLDINDGIAGVITNKPLPDNLVLTVSRDSQRDHYLLELLESERFSQCNSVIVYCIRRDECERVASLIRSSMQGSAPTLVQESVGSKKRKRFSWIVEAYHAGMSAAKRRRVQQAFMSGELRIVVATVAFGMGINKSDIRGVIHYNMPGSFESYVQEVGRAGRDGLPAQCHVFIDRESKDRDELLRHIHANSIERHVIRKMLQKVFLPCGCSKMMKNKSEGESSNAVPKCQGHEVAFSVDETVSELDVPPENIATLLCYLELHPKKFAKVLSNVYINCRITSYGGPSVLLKAAEMCPPLAMAVALQKKRGMELDKTGLLEFCVIEVAAAIGWESGVVKYHLKNLEWKKQNGLPKKSLLRVEFNTLGFRVKSPGDLTPTELDAALDSLFERTQLQEKTMLHQLQEVSKALFAVSFSSILQCSTLKDETVYTEHSNDLKEVIRNYFSRDTSVTAELILDERPINNEQVISDVRGLIATYRDCTFTGRAVARILQGISSPNFPAIVWGRCRYWRSHISADFYKLLNVGKQQIILMR